MEEIIENPHKDTMRRTLKKGGRDTADSEGGDPPGQGKRTEKWQLSHSV